MKKLKISFANKAEDNLTEEELRKKIEVFLEDQNYEKIETQEHVDLYYRKRESSNIGPIYLDVFHALKTVLKSTAEGYAPFTNEELKFFDSLGFKMEASQAKLTGQNIEDWFENKGLDSLTEKEKRKKIEMFLVNEGYKDIRGKKENEVTYTRIEDKNEHSIEVIYSSNVVKKILNSTYYEKFTNRELRFFDSLGFKIQLYQSKITGQIIEDWFAKGLDAVDSRELVKQKLKELGWKHNTATATIDVFVSVDDTAELSNKLLKQIRLDWKYKTVACHKFIKSTAVHTDAPTEILKLLDDLGFEYSDAQKSTGDYNIEDWFIKANDQLTKLELVKLILAKLKSLGYAFNLLSLRRGEYSIIKTEEELDETMKKLPKDFDNFSTLTAVSGANRAKEEETVVNFRNMTIEKILRTSMKASNFTNEELQFFDRLGFSLSEWHERGSSQKIEDWFMKAEDMINVNNPLALSEAVEKFYKALYPGDIYDFKMEKSSWQGSSGYEIYYRLRSENDEKINTKHRVLLLKYDNKSKAFEISKDVETDRKGFYTTMNAERFTNKELEFFDKLGFTMNDAHDIEQEIEDWFK